MKKAQQKLDFFDSLMSTLELRVDKSIVMELLMRFHPSLQLGLCQTDDVLRGIGGCLTAANVQEVHPVGSLIQILLITSRIAQLTKGIGLDQGSGLGIELNLADGLLHGTNLLSVSAFSIERYYTY